MDVVDLSLIGFFFFVLSLVGARHGCGELLFVLVLTVSAPPTLPSVRRNTFYLGLSLYYVEQCVIHRLSQIIIITHIVRFVYFLSPHTIHLLRSTPTHPPSFFTFSHRANWAILEFLGSYCSSWSSLYPLRRFLVVLVNTSHT